MLRQDIIREATRLTRAGRLVEATALLQQMLRGENAPHAAFRSDPTTLAASDPSIIDLKPNWVRDTECTQSARTTSARPRRPRAPSNRTNNEIGLRLRGSPRRMPPST